MSSGPARVSEPAAPVRPAADLAPAAPATLIPLVLTPDHVIALQRTAGNAAVTRHLARAGGADAGTATEPSPDENLNNLTSFADYVFFSTEQRGIRLKAGVLKEQESAVRGALAGIVDAVLAANKKIATKEMRVGMVVIATTSTRCAIYKGKPVLALDPTEADAANATHEMEHAVMYAKLYDKDPAKLRAMLPEDAVRGADIYLRLKDGTKQETRQLPDPWGKPQPRTTGVGIWMVDPSSRGGKPEHAWEDADEFLASAREAARRDPEGLRKAIEKAKAIDPKVAEPAEDLLVLLGLSRGKSAALPKDRAAAATKHLVKMGPPETLDPASGTNVMKWTLEPATRPRPSPRPR